MNQPPSQAAVAPEKERIPYAQAAITGEWVTVTDGWSIELPEGRKLTVDALKDSGVSICIERPTDDDKISELRFGLTGDAAQSLLVLLMMAHGLDPAEMIETIDQATDRAGWQGMGRLYRNPDGTIRFEPEGDPHITDGMEVFTPPSAPSPTKPN